MVINGRRMKLVAKYQAGVGWGVWNKEFRSWVNEGRGGGHTSHLDFHGRVFKDREAAQAYVDGYNIAHIEAKRFLR